MIKSQGQQRRFDMISPATKRFNAPSQAISLTDKCSNYSMRAKHWRFSGRVGGGLSRAIRKSNLCSLR